MRKLFLFFVGLLLTACTQAETVLLQTITLHSPDGRDVIFHVEIADTPEEHAMGLMFRESLDEDKGMLFVFDQSQTLGFWMKNTLIPLDIIYFDAAKSFNSTRRMVPCRADPCTNYPSRGAVLYALELPAGTVEREQIGPGWTMDF